MTTYECPLKPQHRENCAAWSHSRDKRGELGCGGVALGHRRCHLAAKAIANMQKSRGGRE